MDEELKKALEQLETDIKGKTETEVKALLDTFKTEYESKFDDKLADEIKKATDLLDTKIEGFETRLFSTGRVLLKKPGMLRWDYVEPSVEQIFVDGDQVMVYTPEHKQVVKAKLTQIAASQAPLTLLQGAGKLAEQFDVLPTDQEESRQDVLPLITLVPKPEEKNRSAVTRVVLEIDPSSYLIKKMDLHEISGNISTLRFSNIQVNQGIDTAQLKLIVPEDVIVVDAPVLQQ